MKREAEKTKRGKMQVADFICLDCGESFEYKAHCVMHHIESKHECFQAIETDIKMIVKSK